MEDLDSALFLSFFIYSSCFILSRLSILHHYVEGVSLIFFFVFLTLVTLKAFRLLPLVLIFFFLPFLEVLFKYWYT